MAGETMAILGAGNVGGNLGVRFCAAGYSVRFGVRSGSDVSEVLARCGPAASVLSPAEAAAGVDTVFLTVPAEVAVELARGAGLGAGQVLVDCTNPLRWENGPVWTPPSAGSVTAALAAALPGVSVVKAFNTFGAEVLLDPSAGGKPAPVFLAGDAAEAKARVSTLIRRLGFEAVDAGPLRNAAVLENVAMLWIHLATVGGHGRRWYFDRVVRT